MKDVTLILQHIQDGQAGASEDLFPAVYDELRRLASSKMNFERPDHTLSSTALVHEAYVRLVDVDQAQEWNSRGHFFAAAAEAMRRILIEHARGRLRDKRGGDAQRRNVLTDPGQLPPDPGAMLDFNAALERLEVEDPESAELVKLLLFAGLSVAEAGRTLGMSRKVAYRHWEYVRRWFAANL